MIYLKKFENHAEYTAYTASTEFITPNVSHCIQEIEVHYNPIVPPDYSQEYLTFEALEDGTFQFTNPINYSTDNGTTWVTLEANTATPTIATGNKIMWKATLTPSSSSGIGKFSSTGNFNIEGNPMSLLFGDNFIGQTDLIGKNYAFYQLFNNCSKLISAKNLSLPATTLADNCYNFTFQGCTSLTTAPELPATTLASSCYQFMFYGCTSLTTAPELPATTLAYSCYLGMFQGCTSLTTAPELPATTLAYYCYNGMFQGCTSLTTAPQLPATNLTQGCYQGMFRECTSLTTAPVLPATTLVENCYSSMFRGCTRLTTTSELPATTLANSCYSYMFYGCTGVTTAPVLPATTLASSCYSSMFKSCTSLNYIKAMFTTTPSTTYTSNWVSGVAASGTFVKNSAAEWDVSGVNGIPTGWTVQNA